MSLWQRPPPRQTRNRYLSGLVADQYNIHHIKGGKGCLPILKQRPKTHSYSRAICVVQQTLTQSGFQPSLHLTAFFSFSSGHPSVFGGKKGTIPDAFPPPPLSPLSRQSPMTPQSMPRTKYAAADEENPKSGNATRRIGERRGAQKRDRHSSNQIKHVLRLTESN